MTNIIQDAKEGAIAANFRRIKFMNEDVTHGIHLLELQ
jgi:hypothetical protein